MFLRCLVTCGSLFYYMGKFMGYFECANGNCTMAKTLSWCKQNKIGFFLTVSIGTVLAVFLYQEPSKVHNLSENIGSPSQESWRALFVWNRKKLFVSTVSSIRNYFLGNNFTHILHKITTHTKVLLSSLLNVLNHFPYILKKKLLRT